ncbi:MAG: type 2 isopentenyl-diphosphate Delta-isomerase [Candidatus Diapherotrites archaeon]|nr:type 2 isopentenyl-diphosphate Delta-isomerase [Candidatus Diapherotrites archaeon]
MNGNEEMGTEMRKKQHLEIVAKKEVQHKTKSTGFDDVELDYNCLPELNKRQIDLSTEFLGKKFKAPIMVSGMTGGAEEAKKINLIIAEACQELGIGMGLGSQRAMIEQPELKATYDVRKIAPDIFLAGNIGVAQLNKYSLQQLQKMIEDVQADALAIHLNVEQEAVQPEGDVDFIGCYEKIKDIAQNLGKPVYVKGVGHGISGSVAARLNKTKIEAIDVQGAGGTSWTGIESFRKQATAGITYWDFGMPTAVSIIQCRKNFNKKIIASGGIRNGLDAVKGIILGADLCSTAYPVFKAAYEGNVNTVKQVLEQFIEEIRIGMLLVGAKNIQELHRKKYYLLGKTLNWIDQSD